METSPPPPEPPAPVAPLRRSRQPIVIGFLIGVAIWLLPVICVKIEAHHEPYAGIPLLIFACFLLPPISLVLAIIRRTRRVGLGLLLACGLGWLILGAICGGVFR